MKCGKCGNNEAVFHYKSMINGTVTELHLCQECANTDEFRDLFKMNSGMERPFYNGFNELFGGDSKRPFVNRMRDFTDPRGFVVPVYGFTPVFLENGIRQAAPEIPKEASEERIPRQVDPVAVKQRELGVLKYELEKAVKAEEFEKAAELRDKILGLEEDV